MDTFQQNAILELKTARTTQSMRIAVSFESPVPELLADSRQTGSAHPVTSRSSLGALTSYRNWDLGDSMGGITNVIRQGLVVLERSVSQQTETLYGQTNPQYKQLIDAMRAESSALLIGLCDEVSALHTNLLHLSYGAKNYSDAEKKETWEYCLVFLDVYFAEQFKKRSFARGLNSYPSATMAKAVALWATVQGIQVHRDFKNQRYREHPRVFPKMQTHLTQNCVRRNEFAGMATTFVVAQQDIEDLQSEQTRLREVLVRLEAKLGRVANVCGAPDEGGGGGGFGGAAAVGDKRKKRAAKRAAADAGAS
eukprot:scaffold50352_cov40-Cyclotella_meneghiniana.AAC.3